MGPRLIGGIAAAAVALAVAGGVLWTQRHTLLALRPEGKPPLSEANLTSPNPSFETVKIEPDGHAAIAGRALAGARVTVTDGNLEIGNVVADSHGEWTLMSEQSIATGARELVATAINPDGESRGGSHSVILVVPERGRDIAGRPREGKGQALALLVPTAKGTPRVLQSPVVPAAGDAASEIGIAAIDYDKAGRLSIAGHAKPGAAVQLYLEGTLIGRIQADGDGQWGLRPERALEPGNYQFRADQVEPGGRVAARAEVLFQRRPAGAGGPGEKPSVSVVGGSNLWTVVRRTAGDGPRFTAVFDVAQPQTRDPDTIHPGQIFVLPTQPEAKSRS